jgi:hypothetical protein
MSTSTQKPLLLKDISDNDFSCTKNTSSQMKAKKDNSNDDMKDEHRVDA